MNEKIIQSAGGIVYYIDNINLQPKFLLIKRFALSKKIEWVAPKGKIKSNEKPMIAAIREVAEETGLKDTNLRVIKEIGVLSLSLHNEERGNLDKDITFFLIEIKGDPNLVKIDRAEGYLGFHKWATIQEVYSLVLYSDLRKIFKNAYDMIIKNNLS